MRNADNPEPDSWTPEPGLYGVESAHRSRRRRQVAIGVGLAVVIGGGAFAAYQVFDDDAAPVARVGALDPTTAGTEPSASADAPDTAKSTGGPSTPARTKTATPRPATDAERIKAARSAA